jgi:hypothetical protein
MERYLVHAAGHIFECSNHIILNTVLGRTSLPFAPVISRLDDIVRSLEESLDMDKVAGNSSFLLGN